MKTIRLIIYVAYALVAIWAYVMMTNAMMHVQEILDKSTGF